MMILIADDNDQNLYMLQFLLEKNDFKVLVARNGQDALDLAHQNHVDLIVTDILMPVMDGFHLCRIWKKDEALKEIPFVFYTATYTDPKDEKFALSLGADRFVIKPAEPDHLMAIIYEVIRDYQSGQLEVHETDSDNETYLQGYADTLVRKLESKIEELEASNRQLAEEIVERQEIDEAMRDERVFTTALIETGELLNSTLNFDEVLQRILDVIGDVIPHHGANIMLLDDNNMVRVAGVCDCYKKNNLPKLDVGLTFELDKFPVLERMIQTQEAILIEDTHSHADWFVVQVTAQVRCYISVPIVTNEEVIGFLNLDAITPGFFTPKHAQQLQAFGNQAAIAVQNAQIFQKLESYNEELAEAVNERTTEITQANRELQKLSRIKDEFVANVSHELKTPITNLVLHHYMLRNHPENLEKHLTVLERETSRLEHIVDDLLNLSRLDQGRTNFTPQLIDLNPIAQNLVFDRQLQAETKSLTLSFSGASELPKVLGDEGLFEQALSILLTNALNYTPVGGQVSVRTRIADQNRVIVEVEDTGTGIPEEEQAYLFTRFFRGTRGRESGTAGTGLGLSIAQEIIERMQGSIDVESTVGVGSLFRLSMPIPSQDGN